ncbi:NAD+ synthase [Teredinibacter haidensis]|uniref:NAD+ synthase n=1 Tax=Teredinibacter haidensis TaxID=2731755 RepID=UPI000948DB6B|nr:NAD+ synthase [Teredinibacter haidensis]
MSTLRIAMAQINPLAGDISGNLAEICRYVGLAEDNYGADVVVFPELTLTGYPPEDLLLRPSCDLRVARALQELCAKQFSSYVVVGYPKRVEGELFNMAGVIHRGKLVYEYAKQCLPNYQVFDEKRYFAEGRENGVFECKGVSVALSICEDIWDGGPVAQAKTCGADLLLNLNASPFHQHKQAEREALVSTRAKEIHAPILYVNQVGGQDELVFDGGSFAADSRGEISTLGGFFLEQLAVVSFDGSDGSLSAVTELVQREQDPLAIVYQALVLGVRDYVNKNHFKGVVLGLSGGIDSALTLAIAADALGPERVHAVMMPFRYTSDMSKNDAEDEAIRLGVGYRSISIEPMYDAFTAQLEDAFTNTSRDTTEENIQARSRGVLLMAISNKLGYLVLTTGNKSEMAVGYATLYGDMAGGLDVLKDVPKTLVFELSRYRNTIAEVIPESVITRPPSAELAPDQKDEDSLPPYEVLDQILEMYIEQDFSAQSIIDEGFNEEEVKRVLRMVDINEYKRRQAPVGIRISRRAFGRDRRYPITNGWQIGD